MATLKDENLWESVETQMLLDKNGEATLIYSPPSLRSRALTNIVEDMAWIAWEQDRLAADKKEGE